MAPPRRRTRSNRTAEFWSQRKVTTKGDGDFPEGFVSISDSATSEGRASRGDARAHAVAGQAPGHEGVGRSTVSRVGKDR